MGKNMHSFSKTEIILITCIIALFVFIAIFAAYPQGMKISPSYKVVFNGDKNVFIAGDSNISGEIKGICIMNNISYLKCTNVSEVEINGDKFTGVNVIIEKGDGEMEIDGTLSLCSFTLIYYNATEKKLGLMACENLSFNTSSITAIVKNSSIMINEKRWEGDQIISLKGRFHSFLETKMFIFPAEGISLYFKEGKVSDCGILEEFLDEEDIELPPLPFDINGFVFSDGGNVTVNENCFNSNFTIARGRGHVFFGGNYKNYFLEGTMYLIFVNGEVYSNEKTNILSFIPDKLLIFWPLAVGVWILAWFFEKKMQKKCKQYDKEIGGIALVIHLFFIFMSFYLWDKEIEYQFGKSVISAIMSSLNGGFTTEDWIIAPFEFIPWMIIIVLLGIPVRIMLSSILSFIGLETIGKGIGKGIGLFISFLVGVFYISFFLNIILSPFLKSFIG
jgi:hypothetical protein